MGVCVGILIAATNPDFKTVAVFYGGSILAPWGDGPSLIDLTANINSSLIGFFD